MNYSVEAISEKQTWEACISIFPEANFLQSWEWGVFQERIGHTVYRMAVYADGVCVACALGVVEPARRGTYITVAGGPLLTDWYDSELQGLVIGELQRWAMDQNAVFVRIRPQQLESPQALKVLREFGFRQAPMHLTADTTLQLDVRLQPEELLAQMRKNTRYSIRKAEREEITVLQSQDPEDILQFTNIQNQLAERQQFIPFSYNFLREQFTVFAEQNKAVLFKSYQGETLLAEAFVIFDNGEAVYHYGVSTEENHTLPGSYACQWAAILEAQQRGCTRYNFWGVAPEEKKDHRFAGVSIFKRGFGGKEVPYIPAQDLPTSAWYPVVYLFETFRRLRRGL